MRTLARKAGPAVAGLALVVAGIALPAPAVATAGSTTAPQAELMRTQMNLISAAEAISSAVRSTAVAGIQGSGLAAISAKPERGQVWVYWKGEVPAAVQRAVDARGARIIPAAYSERELLAAMERIGRAGDKRITEIAPMPDGSGLSVSVTGSVAEGSAMATVAAAGVKVLFTPNSAPMSLASRQIDSNPYRSGAKFLWDEGGSTFRCTTGFPVLHRGVRKMLTAGHCGADGLSIKRGDGVAWGTVGNDNNARDTMLITPLGRNTLGAQIYEGPHDSNTTKPISFPALDSFLDTLVCTSGAKTGEHCKIRIKQKNVMITVADSNGEPYSIFPLVKAEHDNHTVAVGGGDSGGPVVAMDSLGPAPFFPGDFVNVYPMGTITAIDTTTSVPCGPVDGTPSPCAWRMFYAGILDSLAFYGATIVNG